MSTNTDSYINDQQLGQHQPTFSPPSRLAHSPKKPSPLRNCQIASIPDLLKHSTTILVNENETSPTRVPSLRNQTSADYLRELRTNRAARLNGSRPPPPSRIASKRQRPSTSAGETLMPCDSPSEDKNEPGETTIIDYRAHSRTKSMDTVRRNNFAGRPLFPAPSAAASLPMIPDEDQPGKKSTEALTTRTESPEVQSLRKAMNDVELDEEARIHKAAQDEAAELVYKHRTGIEDSPVQGYRNPDVFKDSPQRDYRAHLRTRSALPWNTPPSEKRPTPTRSVQSSIEVRPTSSPISLAREDARLNLTRGSSEHTTPSKLAQSTLHQDDPFIDRVAPRSSKGKSYEKLAGAVASDVAQSRRRASSGTNRRNVSEGQKGAFPSPGDKIFEETDEPLKAAREAEAEKAAEKATAEKAQEKAAEQAAEVAQEKAAEEVPRYARRNPFARVRLAQEKFEKFEKKESPSGYSVKRFDKDDDSPRSGSVTPVKRLDRIEIYRNPPSQSRQAGYTKNSLIPATPPARRYEVSEVEDSPLMKDGKEIRSDDIRAATAMRRKDRSSNLIQPTAVSDSPGRPIVSFQSDWKMKEIELKEERVDALPDSLAIGKTAPSPEALSGKPRPQSPARSPTMRSPASPFSPSRPAVHHTASAPLPPIPSIVLPEGPPSPTRTLPEEPDIPSITLQNDFTKPAMPIINEPFSIEEPARSKAAAAPRPLPVPVPSRSSPTKPSSRPLPTTAQTSPFPTASHPHYTPSVRRTTALCAHCALPIAGRILSAAGERFHPACFKCHHCSINLECVAFYPEPDKKRQERLARIYQRQQDLDTQIPEGVTEEDMQRLEEEDGDEALRFFCHLDFHEFFSPRCKSCKTPIEGEVVVACGSEWHVGHFFCAQCGDVSLSCLWFSKLC